MNAKSRKYSSDLDKVDAHVITQEEYDDIPELSDADLARATWKIGDSAVSATAGRAAFSAVLKKKKKINIALDSDVVEWFKQQAGGRGYQTLINATLREAMSFHSRDAATQDEMKSTLAAMQKSIAAMETTLRKVVHEKAAPGNTP
ncbi:BrnA antitoxin family protein [Methylococcus sp. ANG]|uniref:BrnA antitoxin family protein n=1 Tax=Methylococcus sp. ANG TaxID=3231903 RepID=UPI0034593881